MELPEVARDTEVAAFIGSSKGALAQDRHRGRGIPYVRLGASRIRYLRADVLNFLNENRVVPTDVPTAGTEDSKVAEAELGGSA